MAGGHAAFNPEPVADFIDAAVLGDGEEIALKISAVIQEWKAERRPGGRDGLLLRLAAGGGVYVPRFFDVDYADDGMIERVVPNRAGVPPRVVKHTLMDLDAWPYPKQPLGAAGRDGARAVLGGDLPRLHPGLPVLPGRDDHPAGARAEHRDDRRDGAGRHRGHRPGGGGAAQPVQRRPLRDRPGHPAARRPLRGEQRVVVPAEHAGGRVQHRPGQRAVPQRPTLRTDLRPRRGIGAAPEGDQQDGQRAGPDRHRGRRVRQRLAPGQALLHVRAADRDRRGRAGHRRAGQEGDQDRSGGQRPAGHPLHGEHRRVRAQAPHAVPVGGPG